MAEIQTNTDHCDPSHDDLSSLGRVLREERERLGMSSKDLADSLHMGREHGANLPMVEAALENFKKD